MICPEKCLPGHYFKDFVYTGDYLQYLKGIIEIIGKLNRGVIIGRRANYIHPAKGRFSVRVIAPRDIRVKNVAFFRRLSPWDILPAWPAT
jgi:hypothetical protein